MLEGINNRIFFFFWRPRRFAVLTLREIIVDTLYDTAFLLCLRNIQVCYMDSIVFLHPVPDLIIGRFTLRRRQIHFIHFDLYIDVRLRSGKFGQ